MTRITKGEIDNILTAMKSANWVYIIRTISRINHEEQFMLLSTIPNEYLQDFHRNAYEVVQHLQKEYYETQYACDTSVTILRNRGKYPDQKQDDDTLQLRKDMFESIDNILEGKEIKPKIPICPWCLKDYGESKPLSWDQFKEVWVCRSHGSFDESQLKDGV